MKNLKKILTPKGTVTGLEGAEVLFREVEIDINDLGIMGISPDIPRDSENYTINFENLRVVPYESEEGATVRLLGKYTCVYTPKRDNSNRMFQQRVEEGEIDYTKPISNKD